MLSAMFRALLFFLSLGSAGAWAAAAVQPLTPLYTSVFGGERQVYSVRFFDSLGRPSANESVFFSNDACGYFENGGFSTSVKTDTTGTASVTFTARAQGITCWLTAQAGVSVTFNVFTYTLGQVSLAVSTSPIQVRATKPFTFTTHANAGAYPIYNADIAARIVPADAATIVPMTSGSDTGRDFTVTPSPSGKAFEVEAAYRGLTRRVSVAANDQPYQDMWWGGSAENGWGMSLVQHGERLFAVIYAYDAAGAPTWYVMPGGTWTVPGSVLTGPLYSPRGSAYSAYDVAKLDVGTPVGTATLTFNGADSAWLDYAIGAASGRKTITRQEFGPPESVAAPVEAGDMWWGGAAQNGWGIALLQQFRTLFGVWFTYDASGAPTWFVMPAGYWSGPSTWEGRIYRTMGSPWLGRTYDPSLLRSSDVGSFSLRFEPSGATMSYTIEGKPGTMALMRQPL